MKKIALIPSYEPDEKLIELVEELKKTQVDIIVVNDGSKEKYNNIFEKIKEKAFVISYKTNKGKGYALKKGLQFIKEHNTKDYIVVTMDSDGQHTVEDALKLCNYIEKNPTELVLGKRNRDKKIPIKSKIGNEITKIVYKLATGISIYDTQTGLRAFSNILMDKMLNIEGNRYEYEMNVLLQLPKKGIKIKEIEIETIYMYNNSGSHFNIIKDSARIYKQIIKFSCSSLISFFVDYVLYSLLIIITKNIVLSNIVARIISCSVNYTINKNIVFKNKDKIYKSIVKYFALAISILTLNTILLNVFVNKLGINAFIGKIIVEIFLFIISWTIQKKAVFKEK